MDYIIKMLDRMNDILIAVQEQNPKKVLTVEQAAKYLGVSTSTLYKWCCSRVVPHSKVKGARTLFFDRDEITAWALTNKIPTREQLTGKVSAPFKTVK